MDWYLALANLMVGGKSIVWGAEVQLPATEEVRAIVDAGFLLPRLPDGTYPAAKPEPRRCCGG